MPASSSFHRPALLDGLVDYAGLFPPAALALDAAAAQFVAHRAQPEAWMLGSFVVPIAQTTALAERLPADLPAHLSVLGSGGGTPEAFLDALDADFRALDALEAAAPHLTAPTLEVKIPTGLPPVELRRLVEHVNSRAAARRRFVFLEVPLSGLDAASRRTHPLDVVLEVEPGGAGVKFRTGGLVADAFPSCADLAVAIGAALDAGVPFKCTAGLHHPVRMHRDEVGTRMHGFLNVFGGAVLRHAGGVDAMDLEAVLADEDAAAWGWTDDGGLRYRNREVSAEDVRRGRRLATGFGSCSFDEPVDDLRALGLLPADGAAAARI